MTAFISHTSIDCTNAYSQSHWWQQVLGYREEAEDPNEPGDEECLIYSPTTGHRLLFIEVPEDKSTKNRIHFDLRPAEGTRDQELARLIELGASPLHDLRRPDGTGWVVLTDPEDNEFCILRSEAEVAANPPTD